MPADSFPQEVIEQLKHYVYRLIDPRNGETFYVGKGQGNQVFSHATGDFTDERGEEDATDLKLLRIKEIKAAGLDVSHVIHRHGIDSPRVAYEIEAALIDAYPGLTNKVKGHSKSFGLRHAEEIIREYKAEPFHVRHRLLLISINVRFGYEDFSVYEAVRCAWKVNKRRAEECELVLARKGRIVVGVFRPEKWIKATHNNFPKELDQDQCGKWGFVEKTRRRKLRNCTCIKGFQTNFCRRKVPGPVQVLATLTAHKPRALAAFD